MKHKHPPPLDASLCWRDYNFERRLLRGKPLTPAQAQFLCRQYRLQKKVLGRAPYLGEPIVPFAKK